MQREANMISPKGQESSLSDFRSHASRSFELLFSLTIDLRASYMLVKLTTKLHLWSLRLFSSKQKEIKTGKDS